MSVRRATGQAAFAGDLALPGLLHVALRRSPHARARVALVDATAARALPGVAAVLTPEDAPALLAREMRFHGDRLAAAAAEEPELARRAIDATRIDLEPLAPTLDCEAAAGDEAAVAGRLVLAEGDVDAALAAADRVVQGEWRVPFSPAVVLEPPLAITWLDEDRRLVVRTSADSPFRVRGALAERLALPAARIRVVRPLVAGGSGGRAGMAVEDLCALVTLRTGRPARVALSATDELTTTPGRPAQRARVRLALRDGRITAIDLRLLVDIGADGANAAELLRASARHALGLYRAGSLRLDAVAVRTNHPPASAPRGADGAAALAIECAVDEAATLLDEDPAAFRVRQLRAADEGGAALLERLGEAPGADEARAVADLLAVAGRGRRRRTAENVGATRPGVGLGIARRSAEASSVSGGVASLRLLDDGSLTLGAGPSAAGGTEEATYTAAAAAILGLPEGRVVSAAADTDSAAFEAGDSSFAPATAGLAVEEAARLARERIREAGARLLGIPPAQALVEHGRVGDGRGSTVTFAEIGAAALNAGEPLFVTARPAPGSSAPSCAAAQAEVEVDAETGIVRVARVSLAIASAPPPDPRGPEGVVEGAVATALEHALAGGLEFDAEGRPLVRSFRVWPLVSATDMPAIAVTFVPSATGSAPFGVSGLADVAGRAALAAIANAVADATGGRVRALPLAPAAVLDALDAGTRR